MLTIFTATFLLLMALVLYLAPTGVAINRQHPQAAAIFWLNLLLGWTMLGWVAALVWAMVITAPKPTYYREIAPGHFVPVHEIETAKKENTA